MGVRITVLGCSGSVTGPDSPASGYLLTAPDTPPLVIDFGGGVLGALQRYADPNDVQVLLSHLHADHCLDLPGLFVWRRYGPTPAPARGVMYGPANTWARLGAASSPEGGEIDDFSDIFDVRPWVDGEAVNIGSLNVLPRLVCHPTESYGMRFTDPSGASFVYSGDTGVCDALVELARGADVFLCEASWTHSPDRPPKLHLSGTEAGQMAAAAGVSELLLTHIPPWTSREDVISEAKAEFDGPVHAVVCGETFDVPRR
ncbi:MBL fold metallo-hydrolase [Mycobacterium sp. CPCC 205372]|uniref:MBL fold metallo-hydrolase n=3 Tax=Mycobacteriaceae TaxID=1762 RepID=A0A9X3BUW1_9MYCO|nr:MULTISPECIES: cyclic nucleotide-degrading phosphodiesterase [Mycobacteriaceae]MCV7171153.1 MBL fold metallo-hydrolase [[Mycobacterium] manitobense]MCZ8378867.1 MBL fold metallo-hydrolase [Mycobacterium hippophais]MDO3636221.1 cyclic nucleotide-degrading phosphodiesterase [Mycolicibacterium arseniciresistens]